MGDVIQLLETVSVNTQVRHDGKAFQYEICIVYPDYLERDNRIKKYMHESTMNADFVRILNEIETVFI